MSVSFFEFSPFSHYVFLKTVECPVIIMCYSLYILSKFMVIDVRCILMLFTTANQM